MNTAVERNLRFGAQEREEYQYQHFSLPLMLRDLRFGESALQPGDTAPDVALTDLDGVEVHLSELVCKRPVVLVTGSLTCPMTASSVPSINRLGDDFGQDVDFVSVYVREAHPAELLPQPASIDQKAEHARSFKDGLDVRTRVLVDDVDGTLHRLLDSKPNAAFVFDASGLLVYRSLWASDEAGLRRAIESIRAGDNPQADQSTRMVLPILRALGSVSQTMSRAGSGAHRDLLFSAPPMEIGGLLAGLLGPVPNNLRGPLLMVAGLAAAVIASVVVLAAA